MSLNIGKEHPHRNPLPPGQLLTLKEAAAYLGVSTRWLESNREIVPVNIARPGAVRRMLRYRVSDLDAFAASRRTSLHEGGES